MSLRGTRWIGETNLIPSDEDFDLIYVQRGYPAHLFDGIKAASLIKRLMAH